MRVAVLGAGGVGGYFGGRLAQAGVPVAFIVRPDRADQLRARGLVLRSPFGDWRGSVDVRTAFEIAEAYDVVAIACKAHGLDAAIHDIRAAARRGTRILPLLNGVRHLDQLAESLPEAVVLGGLAHLMVSVAPDGAIQHSNRLHTFRFGGRDGGADPVAGALERSLAAVPIDARGSTTILADMWAKFQMLAALAGVTCLLRAPVGVIAEAVSGAEIMIEALRETAAVAAAEGFPVSEEHLRTTEALLTERSSRFSSSMLRDIEADRPTEAAHVVGDMAARALAHRIPAPILRIALSHLQAYEIGRTGRMAERAAEASARNKPAQVSS